MILPVGYGYYQSLVMIGSLLLVTSPSVAGWIIPAATPTASNAPITPYEIKAMSVASSSITIVHPMTVPTIRTRTRGRARNTSLQSATSAASSEMQTSSSSSSPSLNPLLKSIQPSKTVEIFSLVKELEAQGQTITSLCVGEPDFQPPRAVVDAAIAALQDGSTKYTAVTGTAALRTAISNDLRRRKDGLHYNPATEIVVANGAKQAVYQGILATVGAGDGVLIPAPYWPSYPEMVRLVGAEPIVLETKSDDGFLINPEALRTILAENPKIRLLIFCNPSNPTGGVHDEAHCQALANVLKEFPNVWVLADEIYERLVYSDDDHDDDDDDGAQASASQACAPAFANYLFDRTMTVNGFSKAYSMTGFRLGYLAAPASVARAVTTLQSQLTSCASSISQAAGVAALTQVPESELLELYQQLKNKRDYVLQRLAASLPNVKVRVPPRGAFYVLPDVSHYLAKNGSDGGNDDVKFCVELLQRHQLAIVPGSAFGAPGTVRLSYATSMEELDAAMTKLETFIRELEK